MTFKKTSMMRAVERANGDRPIEELVKSALTNRGTVEGAAEDLGVSPATLRTLWMPRMGIELKAVVVQVAQTA